MSTGEWARYLSEDLGVGLPPAEVAAVVIDGPAGVLRRRDVDRAGTERQACPDIYLAVASRLGRPPDHCAAVEDSSNGLRSAAAAGLTVIAVPRPEYPADPAALAQARLVLSSLTDLDPENVADL